MLQHAYQDMQNHFRKTSIYSSCRACFCFKLLALKAFTAQISGTFIPCGPASHNRIWVAGCITVEHVKQWCLAQKKRITLILSALTRTNRSRRLKYLPSGLTVSHGFPPGCHHLSQAGSMSCQREPAARPGEKIVTCQAQDSARESSSCQVGYIERLLLQEHNLKPSGIVSCQLMSACLTNAVVKPGQDLPQLEDIQCPAKRQHASC